LDIWNNPEEGKYQQILLQVNAVKIFGTSEQRISFDLTNQKEYIKNIISLENKCIDILKRYLHQINKKGKFNFMSLLKSEEHRQHENGVHILTLSTNPADYSPSLFDSAKNKVNMAYFNEMQKNNTVNIIIEPYAIQLDMQNNDIMIDIRLRLVIENMIAPARFQVSDPDLFISDSDGQETIYENQTKGNSIFKESSNDTRKNNTMNEHIKKNFDLTQTEIFEDDIKVPSDMIKPPIIERSGKNRKHTRKNPSPDPEPITINEIPDQQNDKSNSDDDNIENILEELIEENINNQQDNGERTFDQNNESNNFSDSSSDRRNDSSDNELDNSSDESYNVLNQLKVPYSDTFIKNISSDSP